LSTPKVLRERPCLTQPLLGYTPLCSEYLLINLRVKADTNGQIVFIFYFLENAIFLSAKLNANLVLFFIVEGPVLEGCYS